MKPLFKAKCSICGEEIERMFKLDGNKPTHYSCFTCKERRMKERFAKIRKERKV